MLMSCVCVRISLVCTIVHTRQLYKYVQLYMFVSVCVCVCVHCTCVGARTQVCVLHPLDEYSKHAISKLPIPCAKTLGHIYGDHSFRIF